MTFNVRGDPSRSGAAPVPVPGWVRLALELTIFGLAVAALHHVGRAGWAWTLAVVVGAHYAASWDHVAWLLRR